MDCFGCKLDGKCNAIPAQVYGNALSPIHIMTRPSSEPPFHAFAGTGLHFYDGWSVSLLGKPLTEFAAIYSGWYALDVQLNKKIWGLCSLNRDYLLSTLVKPRLKVLVGPEVIKHEIMRGGPCPDLRLSSGKPTTIAGTDTRYLLLPLPDYRVIDERWANAVDRCAEGLCKSIKELLGV